MQQIRRLIDFLPSSNKSSKEKKNEVNFNKIIPSLDNLVPKDKNRAYDMRDLVFQIADAEDFFEVQKDYANKYYSWSLE